MARSTIRSQRKSSGGRYRSIKGKILSQLARFPALTKIGKEAKVTVIRGRGGTIKLRTLEVQYANVMDAQGKTQKAEILTVTDNPSNPHLVRRNIMTKGATIDTKIGKAKITNRPGQEGMVNAKLV